MPVTVNTTIGTQMSYGRSPVDEKYMESYNLGSSTVAPLNVVNLSKALLPIIRRNMRLALKSSNPAGTTVYSLNSSLINGSPSYFIPLGSTVTFISQGMGVYTVAT